MIGKVSAASKKRERDCSHVYATSAASDYELCVKNCGHARKVKAVRVSNLGKLTPLREAWAALKPISKPQGSKPQK